MIAVDMIGQIRRAYFEQRRPIKEIVRTLSVSRATVRKVIRGQATEFKYERGVQPAPKLGEWVETLTEMLENEAKLPKRERRSTQRLFEELRGHGYDGAHDSVHRFVRSWRDEQARVPARAYVPMSFAPGEAYWTCFRKVESFPAMRRIRCRSKSVLRGNLRRRRFAWFARAGGRSEKLRTILESGCRPWSGGLHAAGIA
jgi:hypothetical protein